MAATPSQERSQPSRRFPLRTLAAAGILTAGACLLIAVYALSLDDRNATTRDFIQYWAAGQQLAHGANPYDVEAILRLEKSRGLEGNAPKVSFSPPVALLFALPLGWVSAKNGLIGWHVLLLICNGTSMWILWRLHGRPQSRWHVLAFGFPPFLACMMAGQLGAIFLLDFVLFLWLHKRHPWLAGAALLFCALKPHLFLPCVVVLLIESARRRDFRVPAGFAAALAASCGLSLMLDPRAWAQYQAMMRSTRVMDVFLPTVGVALRFAIDRQARWIEFVPEAAACVWAAWYFWTRRERWQWTREGLLVLLVAVVCTPYSFFTDQTVLFPAILAGICAAERSRSAWILLGLVAAGCMVGLIFTIQLPSPFYLWTAPAWLAWYLYAKRFERRGEPAAMPA